MGNADAWRLGFMDRHNRNSRNKIAVVSTGVIGILVLALTACNTNSDAISVLQAENTSLHATLAAYQNIGPTVTAQATANAQKLATAQSDLGTARAQNRELITQLNGGSNPNAAVNSQQTSGGASGALDTTAGSNAAAGNTTGGNTNPNTQAGATPNDPTSFAIAQVTTAHNKDANGCASNPATEFSTTDSAIWVIADVRNYKRGTEFTAKWSGSDFNHENTWTINSSGAQICVHFYIEPDTLGMAAGTYTVTMSTADGQSQSTQFTVQGQPQDNSQAAATP
jgi:hypothetical protein